MAGFALSSAALIGIVGNGVIIKLMNLDRNRVGKLYWLQDEISESILSYQMINMSVFSIELKFLLSIKC